MYYAPDVVNARNAEPVHVPNVTNPAVKVYYVPDAVSALNVATVTASIATNPDAPEKSVRYVMNVNCAEIAHAVIQSDAPEHHVIIVVNATHVAHADV